MGYELWEYLLVMAHTAVKSVVKRFNTHFLAVNDRKLEKLLIKKERSQHMQLGKCGVDKIPMGCHNKVWLKHDCSFHYRLAGQLNKLLSKTLITRYGRKIRQTEPVQCRSNHSSWKEKTVRNKEKDFCNFSHYPMCEKLLHISFSL